jgi:hypothetical protein
MVYDYFRISYLNVKYYGYKLAQWRRINYFFDIIIAISASSGIASFGFFQDKGGEIAWAVIGGIAAILSILKSTFSISNRVEILTKLHAGHQQNFLSLSRVNQLISDTEGINAEIKKKFNVVLDRFSELSKYDEPHPSRRLIDRFQKEVEQEYPPDRFWLPAGSRAQNSGPAPAVAPPRPVRPVTAFNEPPGGSAATDTAPQSKSASVPTVENRPA